MTKILLVLFGLLQIFNIVIVTGSQIQVKELCDSYQSFCEKCEDQNANCRNLYKNCGAVFKKAENGNAQLRSKSSKSTPDLSVCQQLRVHCNSCRRQRGKCEKFETECSNFKEFTSLLKSQTPPKLKKRVNQLCQMSGEMCSLSSSVNCCTGLTCQRQPKKQQTQKRQRERHEKVEDSNNVQMQSQTLAKSFPIEEGKATGKQDEEAGRHYFSPSSVCVQAFSMDLNVNGDDDSAEDGNGNGNDNEENDDGPDTDTDTDSNKDTEQMLNEHDFDGQVGIKGHDKTHTCQKMGEPCSTSDNLTISNSSNASTLSLLSCCPGFRCTIDLTSSGNYSDPQWRLENSFCSMENGKNEAEELMAELMGKKRPKLFI